MVKDVHSVTPLHTTTTTQSPRCMLPSLPAHLAPHPFTSPTHPGPLPTHPIPLPTHPGRPAYSPRPPPLTILPTLPLTPRTPCLAPATTPPLPPATARSPRHTPPLPPPVARGTAVLPQCPRRGRSPRG